MFSLSVTIYEILAIEKYMTLTGPQEWAKENVNMQIESACVISYMITIVMFAMSVTIYKIFAIEMCMTLI